jgi:hypothetical protein
LFWAVFYERRKRLPATNPRRLARTMPLPWRRQSNPPSGLSDVCRQYNCIMVILDKEIIISVPQTLVKVTCSYCGTAFTRRRALYNYKKRLGQNQYCSRRCGARANPQKARDVAARFWTKVKKTKTCWVWTAATVHGGYGAFYYKGKMIHAERASYELHVGKLRAGMEVLHKCKNPPCVRPDHLVPGTHTDKLSARGQAKSHAVLKASDVIAIRGRLAKGEKHGQIARDFQVARATITAINTGRNWSFPER